MNKVIFLKPLSGFILDLELEDGLRKAVDMHPFIGQGISADLRDENYFELVAIESGGGIFWPNGYDFCPNFLHDEVPAIEPIVA